MCVENIFFCNGCKLEFDRDLKIPKVLNCGHSICSPCLRKILMENQYCPNCEKKVAREEDHFPVNLSLLSIMKACESFKGLENDPVFCIQKLKEKYTTTKDFLIKKEAAIKSELKIIEKGLQQLQDLNEFDCYKSNQRKIKETLFNLEENYETVNKEILSNFGTPKQFVTLSLQSFKEENEYLNEIYSKLKRDEKVFAVERIENDLQFAQLSERDNMILMHSFSYPAAPPENTSVILFSELKKCFFKKQLCTFLKVSTGLKDVTHLIIIEMIWNSPLSFDFVQLCTGECGHSYKNSLYVKGINQQEDRKPSCFVFPEKEANTNGGENVEVKANSLESGNNINSDEDNNSEGKHNFVFLPTKKELDGEPETSRSITTSTFGSTVIASSTIVPTTTPSIFGSTATTSSTFGSTTTPVGSTTTTNGIFSKVPIVNKSSIFRLPEKPFSSSQTFGSPTSAFSPFGQGCTSGTSSSQFRQSKNTFGPSSSQFGQKNSTKTTAFTSSKPLESTEPSGSSGFSFNVAPETLRNMESNNIEFTKTKSSTEGKTKSNVLRPANFKFDFSSHNFNFETDQKGIGKIDETSKNMTDFGFGDLLASSILRVEKSEKEMLNFQYYHKALDNKKNYTQFQPGEIIVKAELDHSFCLYSIKKAVTFKPIGKVIHPVNLINYLNYDNPNNLKVLDCGILFEI